MSTSEHSLSSDDVLTANLNHHDLQAQLINVMGFYSEVERTAIELKDLKKSAVSSLDSEASKKFEKLIDDDLLPCVQFLGESTKTLSQTVTLYQSTASIDGKVD